MLFVDVFNSMTPSSYLPTWIRANCKFAQGLPPINPGLNLAVIAKEVADHLRQTDEAPDIGNMLRALQLKGRDYKAIRKRASEMDTDFFALVMDIFNQSAV